MVGLLVQKPRADNASWPSPVSRDLRRPVSIQKKKKKKHERKKEKKKKKGYKREGSGSRHTLVLCLFTGAGGLVCVVSYDQLPHNKRSMAGQRLYLQELYKILDTLKVK